MSLKVAVSAFAHRSARRSTVAQLLLYSGGIALLLVVLAAWIVSQADEPPGGACYWQGCAPLPPRAWSVLGLADVFAVGLLGLGLFVLAPAAVAAAVAAERRAGTLDQLRTTPLTPLGLTAGIVVGAPAKLYLLLAGPLALHVVAGVTGVIPVEALATSLCVLLCGGLASTLFGLAVALAPRQETGGALSALAVAGVLGVGGILTACLAADRHAVTWAFLHPGGALDATMLAHDGLWRWLVMSPWRLPLEGGFEARLALVPFASCAASLALAAVLARACCRKLAAPHLPLFGKLHALVLFAGAAAAALGAWRFSGDEGHEGAVAILFVLVLTPLAAVLGLFAAPTAEAWSLSLRAYRRPRWFADDAPPHALMWTMAGVLALAAAGCLFDGGSLRDREAIALAWALSLVASLPVFVHFVATRYATAAARWAFGAAITAYLVCQAIAVALVTDRERNLGLAYVQACALAAVLLPAWVAVRQHALRKKLLAS